MYMNVPAKLAYLMRVFLMYWIRIGSCISQSHHRTFEVWVDIDGTMGDGANAMTIKRQCDSAMMRWCDDDGAMTMVRWCDDDGAKVNYAALSLFHSNVLKPGAQGCFLVATCLLYSIAHLHCPCFVIPFVLSDSRGESCCDYVEKMWSQFIVIVKTVSSLIHQASNI